MSQPIRCFQGNAQPHTPFWSVRAANETASGEAEITLYGVISEYSWLFDDISPRQFKDDLERIGQGKPVTLRMDSPGGDPIAASAIASIIASYPARITAQIDGQASSAAVIIALSASHVRILDSAYMMVHEPRVNVLMAALDRKTLQSLHDALTSINDGMVASYAARTGKSAEEIAALLEAETWMNAQEAVSMGFANEIVTGGQNHAARNFSNYLQAYQHVPAPLLQAVAQLPPANEPTTETQAAPDGAEETPATPLAALKLALARAKVYYQAQGVPMLRELIAQRAVLLAEAEGLVNAADTAQRDLTAEERTRFIAIMGEGETPGELAALDVQIEQMQGERERLRSAAEKKFSNQQPQRPESPAPSKTMKRGEFEALSPADQAAFVRGGGKVSE